MNTKNKKGFTLIEMLIVIAIIGILAGVVIYAVSGTRQKAAVSRAIADMTNIKSSIEMASVEGCTAATISITTVTCTAGPAGVINKVYTKINPAPSGITYTVSGTLTAYTVRATLVGGASGTDNYLCDTGGCSCNVVSGNSNNCTTLP